MSRTGTATIRRRRGAARSAGTRSGCSPARLLREAAARLEAVVKAVRAVSDYWYTGEPSIDFGDGAVPEADCRLIAQMSPEVVSHLIPLMRAEAVRADRLGDHYLAAADLDLLRFADKLIEGAPS